MAPSDKTKPKKASKTDKSKTDKPKAMKKVASKTDKPKAMKKVASKTDKPKAMKKVASKTDKPKAMKKVASKTDKPKASKTDKPKKVVKKVVSKTMKAATKKKIVTKIKKEQKNTGFALQKAPFARMARVCAANFNDGIRFTKNALLVLQTAIEACGVHCAAEGYKFTMNCNRVRMTEKDIKNVLTGVKKVNCGEDFAKPGLRRLARKAGVGSVSTLALEALNQYLQSMMHNVLHFATTYMQHARRTTIKPEDINNGLEKAGLPHVIGFENV